MKKSKSIKQITTFLLLLFPVIAFSQEMKKWYIPDFVKAHFAGSMGLISLGTGFTYANYKFETDLFICYLPKKYGFEYPVTLTVKQTYLPYTYNNKTLRVIPFQIGLFINTTFEDRFFTRATSRYPSGYYWWSENIRLNVFIGSRIGFNKVAFFRNLDIMMEFNTNELYLTYYFLNRETTLEDVFSFSMGIKYSFF